MKDKGDIDNFTIHQIKQSLTASKYFNVMIRHRQATLASFFCNYGKREVAGCVFRFCCLLFYSFMA